MLRFGLFSVVDHYPQELGRTTADFYGELLEQAEAADALGFDSFWVAEHHFHEYGGVPRPPVWLAAAAMRTRRIRLGSRRWSCCRSTTRSAPPRTTRWSTCSRAAASTSGVGSGYLTHEYAGFNLDPEEKRARFEEALEVLLRAWTGERFSYEGRYHRVRDVQLNVRPVQRPRPPIWVATLRADSAPRIGARGFPVMLIPYASAETLAQMAEGVADYRAAFVGAGGRPSRPPPCRSVSTCTARRAPRRPGRRRASAWSATCARGSMRCSGRSRPSSSRTWWRSAIPRRSSGSPGATKRRGSRISSPSANFGGLPHKQVLRSMELLARHVLPRFATAS